MSRGFDFTIGWGGMNLGGARNERSAGYYWSRSCGGIPPNAIQAGIDRDGGRIFVGRAYHHGDVLPAKVIENHNTAYVSWDGKEHQKDEFEVLCKDDRTVTCWQECSGGLVPPGAVAVGDRENLYIGRVFHDGTLTPGKIHPSHGCLYLPYGGQELKFRTYEALILKNN